MQEEKKQGDMVSKGTSEDPRLPEKTCIYDCAADAINALRGDVKGPTSNSSVDNAEEEYNENI